MNKKRRPLVAGSVWSAPEGSILLGKVKPRSRISVSVYLRPKSPRPRPGSIVMSHADFATAHGAAVEDVAKIQRFAHQHGLDVVAIHPGARRVALAGSAQAMEDAFRVSIHYARGLHGRFRTHTGPITVPAELGGIVTAVLGLGTESGGRKAGRVQYCQKSTRNSLALPARLFGFCPIFTLQFPWNCI
jgi:kumamolisin